VWARGTGWYWGWYWGWYCVELFAAGAAAPPDPSPVTGCTWLVTGVVAVDWLALLDARLARNAEKAPTNTIPAPARTRVADEIFRIPRSRSCAFDRGTVRPPVHQQRGRSRRYGEQVRGG
jgi:hypothetical protein